MLILSFISVRSFSGQIRVKFNKVVLITINSMESDALIGPMKKTNEICICIVCSGPMRASDSY